MPSHFSARVWKPHTHRGTDIRSQRAVRIYKGFVVALPIYNSSLTECHKYFNTHSKMSHCLQSNLSEVQANQMICFPSFHWCYFPDIPVGYLAGVIPMRTACRTDPPRMKGFLARELEPAFSSFCSMGKSQLQQPSWFSWMQQPDKILDLQRCWRYLETGPSLAQPNQCTGKWLVLPGSHQQRSGQSVTPLSRLLPRLPATRGQD